MISTNLQRHGNDVLQNWWACPPHSSIVLTPFSPTGGGNLFVWRLGFLRYSPLRENFAASGIADVVCRGTRGGDRGVQRLRYANTTTHRVPLRHRQSIFKNRLPGYLVCKIPLVQSRVYSRIRVPACNPGSFTRLLGHF